MSQIFVDALVATVIEQIEAANALTEKVGATSGKVNKDVKDIRDHAETDDAKVLAYREWRAQADAMILSKMEEIGAYIKSEILGVESATEDEAVATKDAAKDAMSKARQAMKAAELMAESVGVELPEFPALLTLSGKASASGGATGTRRLRFAEVTVNGTVVKNLSAVGALIRKDTGVKVTAGDLQKALFETVGTDDMTKIHDASFGWSETDKDGKTHSYDIYVVREDTDGDYDGDTDTDTDTDTEE